MKFKPVWNWLKAGVIFLIAVAAIILPGVPSLAAGTAAFSVSGPLQAVSPGAQFTININIQPNNAIAGAQFCLSFNPSLVSVTNITEGNLLKQNGASTYFSPGQINNSAGTIF